MALTESEELEMLELEEQEAKASRPAPPPTSRDSRFGDVLSQAALSTLPPAAMGAMTTSANPSSVMQDVRGNLQGPAELAASSFPPLAAAKLASGVNPNDPKRLANLLTGAAKGLKAYPGQLKQEVLNPFESFKNRPVSTGMDASMLADLGVSAIPEQAGRASARSMARRALGFPKRMLNTPFARAEAMRAADVALEKGVIPRTGDPALALERATSLSSETGSKVGTTLDKFGFEKIAPEAELDLEHLRDRLTKGTKRGLFAGANQIIDNIKTTILELYGRDVTSKTYNQAKNILGNSLNYLADISSQKLNKQVVRNMAETVRNTVKKLVPEDFTDFLENQRIFNAAETMKKGLNNEMAAQMGNKAVSLPGAVVGAGALATGNIPLATKSLGLWEMAQRRGAGIGARNLSDLLKSRGGQLSTSGLDALMRAAGLSQEDKNQ